MAAVIYLHWTATGYDWIRPGHYHSLIGGDGRVHRLHNNSMDLFVELYGRTSTAFPFLALCAAVRPLFSPSQSFSVTSLCAEAAAIVHSWGR